MTFWELAAEHKDLQHVIRMKLSSFLAIIGSGFLGRLGVDGEGFMQLVGWKKCLPPKNGCLLCYFVLVGLFEWD